MVDTNGEKKMKIYDTHVHFFMKNCIPEAYEIGMARTMKLALKNKMNLDLSFEDAMNKVKEMYDPGGERFLGDMDNAALKRRLSLDRISVLNSVTLRFTHLRATRYMPT